MRNLTLKVPSNYSELLARLSPIVGDEDAKESEGMAGSKSALIDRWVHLGDIGKNISQIFQSTLDEVP